MPRRKWNPDRSDLVDKTIERLREKIRNGELSPSIRPQTLVDEGGDFKYLYFAALTPNNRAPWAVERFPPTPDDPSGFSSFVGELSEGLPNITLINSKEEKSEYTSHKQVQLEEIQTLSRQYKAGDTLVGASYPR